MPLTQSYRTQSVFLTLVRPGRPQKQAVARSDDAVMLLEHVTNTERGYSVLDQLDLMGTDHPNARLSQAAQHAWLPHASLCLEHGHESEQQACDSTGRYSMLRAHWLAPC